MRGCLLHAIKPKPLKNIYILLLLWLDLLDESSLPHHPSSVELAPRPSPPTALLSLGQELEAAHWRAEMRPQAFFWESLTSSLAFRRVVGGGRLALHRSFPERSRLRVEGWRRGATSAWLER